MIFAALYWNTRIGAGADSYGYVSQADLWRKGTLHIRQGFASTAPWPGARWTFLPLGYRPVPDGYDIVPIYAPGLPLLMAAAKTLAGQCALFAIVPCSAGILVFATFLIGCRLERRLVGLAAAWLVATSTTLLYSMMAPMSDVPAAAAWAVVAVGLLADSTGGTAIAGGAAALAILIRPNLGPIAAALAVWLEWHDMRSGRWRSIRQARTPRFLLPCVVAAVFIGMLNARLYGSATRSGYGDLSVFFSLSHVWPNLKLYGGWLASAETPLALFGLAALLVPALRLWPTPAARRGLVVLTIIAVLVWVAYLPYQEWDAWWYLRFLLPAWSMMAIGMAAVAAAIWRLRRYAMRAVAVASLCVLGISGVIRAASRDAFRLAQGEWKYVEAARAVAAATPPDAIVFTLQHSGTLRYYGGRMTIRWDQMETEWLDRSVAWIAGHGHHPYLLLEDWEAAQLRRDFGAANVVARLDWTPILSLRHGTIRLYDALDRTNAAPSVELPETARSLSCPEPVTLAAFAFHR